MLNATCGMQYPLYVPAGAPANEMSYFSLGCVRNGPVRSLIAFAIPFFRASAPPFGIESAKNAMLWGPPETLMKRTVVPGLMVSVAGSNAALVVPSPVILTSTTAPAGSAAGAGAGAALAADAGDAGGAGVAASACAVAGFFSLPQATAPNATSVVSRVNRIANSSSGTMTSSACERVHNIPLRIQKGSPRDSHRPLRFRLPSTTLQADVGHRRASHRRARACAPSRPRRAGSVARRPRARARCPGARHPRCHARLPRPPSLRDLSTRFARAAAPRPRRSGRRHLRARQLEQAGDAVPAAARVRSLLGRGRYGRLGNGLSPALARPDQGPRASDPDRSRRQGRPLVYPHERWRCRHRGPGPPSRPV